MTGQAEEPTAEIEAKAAELAKRFMIADTHIDVPYRLQEFREGGDDYPDVSQATDDGDFDAPRARQGGLDLPFMSIYIPASYQEDGGAKELADELIDMVESIASSAPETFTMVRSVADANRAFEDGKIGFALGLENGEPIEGRLDNLTYFRDRGVRYITLTHSKDNHICDSSYDEARTWQGLSPFGKELVPAMNRAGVMIDVSHISDQAFWQVMELTEVPVIASHSSCRKFTPDWERNVSDKMIQAIADNGGVVHINFGSSFLTQEYLEYGKKRREAVSAFMVEHDVDVDSVEADTFRGDFDAKNPKPFADLQDVVEHIQHVVDLVGVDHVGIGSDYDGVGDSLPTGLKDVSQYPNLIAALLQKGYSDEDIQKICSGNLLRVWAEAETFAGK